MEDAPFCMIRVLTRLKLCDELAAAAVFQDNLKHLQRRKIRLLHSLGERV